MYKKIADFLFISVAKAQGGSGTGVGSVPSSPITSPQDLLNLVCVAFGWMFWGLIAVSSIIIVYAAFTYVTANGDAEKVSKAGKTLLYAAIGIGVALLARAVPLIVAGFLGVQNGALKTC